MSTRHLDPSDDAVWVADAIDNLTAALRELVASFAAFSAGRIDADRLADILAGHQQEDGKIVPPLMVGGNLGYKSRYMTPKEFAGAILDELAKDQSQQE